MPTKLSRNQISQGSLCCKTIPLKIVHLALPKLAANAPIWSGICPESTSNMFVRGVAKCKEQSCLVEVAPLVADPSLANSTSGLNPPLFHQIRSDQERLGVAGAVLWTVLWLSG